MSDAKAEALAIVNQCADDCEQISTFLHFKATKEFRGCADSASETHVDLLALDRAFNFLDRADRLRALAKRLRANAWETRL